MANQTVIVTGIAEVDSYLAQFTEAIKKKHIRKALNESVKVVEKKYKTLAPVDTGALKQTITRRTPKSKSRDIIKRGLYINREKLIERRKAKGGRIGYDKKRDEPFFYAAVVEFGDKDTPAQKPLRYSLYSSQALVKAEFTKQILQGIAKKMTGKKMQKFIDDRLGTGEVPGDDSSGD